MSISLSYVAGKKVREVAVGCMHSLVLTEDGEVYVWGRNDQAQLGDSPHASLAEPTLMSTLHGKSIIGIACGPSQVSNISVEVLGVCLVFLFSFVCSSYFMM